MTTYLEDLIMERGSDGGSELHGISVSLDESEADSFAPFDQGDLIGRRRLIRHFGPQRNVRIHG